MPRRLHNYRLEGIPHELWEAAQIKADAQRPPMTLRAVLLDLLKEWVRPQSPQEPRAATTPQQPASTTIF